MKTKSTVALAVCLSLAAVASAHRLDEYLQATIFSIEENRVHASMRLIPGVAVTSIVLAEIDSNQDGALSEIEQRDYAQKVLRDVSITIDGTRLTPQLSSVSFPTINDMNEGLGEIHIEFNANLPSGTGARKLVLENHHLDRNSVYLVNCLVSRDRNIQIISQDRNQRQSFYQLNYVQQAATGSGTSVAWSSGSKYWFRGITGMFRLGIRHIATGNDHLLFLLTLLLPAPLICFASRWTGPASVRQSLLRILRVVTAFTVGHSITLALAALGVVRVPSRPIEVLIAVSILVSALHALRPLFPGREGMIAAFFGLIHGLAFASTLDASGLGRWERVASIVGFNFGIETMQLVVVASVMPSLLLLSRTPAYRLLRVSGAIFAGSASLGWIGERLFNLHNSFDPAVNFVALHSVWIAAALFLLSLACWSLRRPSEGRAVKSKRMLVSANPTVLNP